MKQSGEAGPGAQALDPKMETAVFGREVEDFIEHDAIGVYLITRARQDIEAAQLALVKIDPHDWKAITALQLDARVANRVRGWIAEAINNGRDAALLLQEDRDNVS